MFSLKAQYQYGNQYGLGAPYGGGFASQYGLGGLGGTYGLGGLGGMYGGLQGYNPGLLGSSYYQGFNPFTPYGQFGAGLGPYGSPFGSPYASQFGGAFGGVSPFVGYSGRVKK